MYVMQKTEWYVFFHLFPLSLSSTSDFVVSFFLNEKKVNLIRDFFYNQKQFEIKLQHTENTED